MATTNTAAQREARRLELEQEQAELDNQERRDRLNARLQARAEQEEAETRRREEQEERRRQAIANFNPSSHLNDLLDYIERCAASGRIPRIDWSLALVTDARNSVIERTIRSGKSGADAVTLYDVTIASLLADIQALVRAIGGSDMPVGRASICSASGWTNERVDPAPYIDAGKSWSVARAFRIRHSETMDQIADFFAGIDGGKPDFPRVA